MQAIKDAVAALVGILLLVSVRITPVPTPQAAPTPGAGVDPAPVAAPAFTRPVPDPRLDPRAPVPVELDRADAARTIEAALRGSVPVCRATRSG